MAWIVKIVRADAATATIPVVVLSGMEDCVERARISCLRRFVKQRRKALSPIGIQVKKKEKKILKLSDHFLRVSSMSACPD